MDVSAANQLCSARSVKDLLEGEFIGIDDLLDFPNDDIECDYPATPSPNHHQASTFEKLRVEEPTKNGATATSAGTARAALQGAAFGSGVVEPGHLCVPCDDLAELEWLSNFVDESFSSGSSEDAATCMIFGTSKIGMELEQKKSATAISNASRQHSSTIPVLESSTSSSATSHNTTLPTVGRGARSKRRRSAVCFWNARILSPCSTLLNHQDSSGSSTLTLSSSYSEAALFSLGALEPLSRVKKLGAKVKPSCKKRQPRDDDVENLRRCLHCASQKTPHWRAGPMGPKTLCNACGVRYKSGRLLPEYRPAASPTFVDSIHSNSHRRVLEMRRKRLEQQQQQHHDNEEGEQRRHTDAPFSALSSISTSVYHGHPHSVSCS